MRTITLALAVVIGLGCFASAAQADDWSLDNFLKSKTSGDWDGFGVGTMVHTKKTQKMTIPGMPEPKVDLSEEKQTLVEITDTEYVVKVETLTAGEWATSEDRVEKATGLTSTVTDVGTGTVTIAGTAYECTKKQVKMMKGEELDETLILWTHEDQGVLKLEFGGEENDAPAGSATVTKLAVSWTLGSTTVSGREMEMIVKTPMGEMKGVMGISLQLPDQQVSMVMSGGQGPMSFEMEEKVVAFVKK